MTDKRVIIGAAAVAGLLLAWIATRGTKDLAKTGTKALVGLAEGTATGIAVGIGEAVGLPDTTDPANRSRCCATMREWRPDMSFWEKTKLSFRVSANCPLPDYTRWAAGGGLPADCN